MHISGLAIENFLSYRHANIDFGPRLNIIAGKNGSGKSNIVSAFAFVFTKLFDDPKRRSEFSFNGDESNDIRVTVGIDNKSGRFPYEGNEIQISKKLGKAASYQINDEYISADRLDKMLMQINVSRSSHYNIVRQGRINDVLIMQPSELYSLLEEACGIKAYKYMRQEIDKNMKKLDELSEELKQQFEILQEGIGQLREDNKIYQKALAIMDQIKKLEYQIQIKQLRDNEKQKIAMREYIILLRNSLAKDQSDMKQIDLSIADIEQERKAINTNFQSEKYFYDTRLQDIDKLVQEKQNILDQIQQLETKFKQASNKSSVLDDLKRKLKEQEKIESEYQQQSDQIYKDIQLLNLSSAADPVQTFKEKIKEYEREVDQFKKEISQIQDKINKVSQEIKLMEDSKQNKSLKELNEELQAAQQNLMISQENLDQHKKDAVERQMMKTKNQQNLEQERQNLKSECDKLNKDCNDQMAQTLMDLYSFAKDKRILLVGCLADLIVVDKQFTQILELVAGRKLLTLIVETLNDAEALIKKNEQDKGGQINIFALELFEEDNQQDLKIPNCIDLSKYIKFTEDFKFPNRTQLLNKIIGRWFIAPNFDQGIKVSQQYGVDTVTQQGQIAYGGGYMTKVGQKMDEKQKIQSIKRILTSNKNIIEQEQLDQMLTSQVDEDVNSTNTLMRDISNYKQDIERITRIKELDYNQLNIKKGDYERLENLRDNLQEQVNSTQNRIKDIETQLKNPGKLKKGFTQEHQRQIDQLVAKRAQIVAKVNQISQEINLINQEILANSGLPEAEKNRFKLLSNQKQAELDEINIKIDRLQFDNQKFFNLEAQIKPQLQKKREEIDKKRLEKMQIEKRLPQNQAQLQSYEEQIKDLEEDDHDIKKELDGKKYEVSEKDEIQNIRDQIRILKKDQNLKTFKFGNTSLFEKIEEIEVGLDDYEKKYDLIASSTKEFREIVKKFDASSQDFAKNQMFQRFKEAFEQLFREMVGECGETKVKVMHLKKDKFGINIRVSFKEGQSCLDWQTFSGGEKTIVALCIILSLQMVDPAPFYILDEFDAALDENYRENCAKCIRRLAAKSQFIIVSFRPELIKADPDNTRYFLVRQKDGVSQIGRSNMENLIQYVDNKNSRDRSEKQDKKKSRQSLYQDNSENKYQTPIRGQQIQQDEEVEMFIEEKKTPQRR
ncbi:hypothetical protein pb186bvf_006039 [Paramecium bursaria]